MTDPKLSNRRHGRNSILALRLDFPVERNVEQNTLKLEMSDYKNVQIVKETFSNTDTSSDLV